MSWPGVGKWTLQSDWHTYQSVPDLLDGKIGPPTRHSSVPPLFLPTAWACVDLLTKKMSSFPFAGLATMDGMTQPAADTSKYQRIARFLNTMPSSLMNRQRFWQLMWWQYFSTGNAYALIHRNSRGMPVELEPVTRTVPPVMATAEPISREPYEFREYGARRFEPNNVLAMHAQGWNWRTDCSPSPFFVAAKALGFLDEGMGDLLRALNDPRNIYSISDGFDPEEAAGIAKINLDELKRAISDSRDPVMMGAQIFRRNSAQIGTRSAHMEDFRWVQEEVCRSFAVPPRAIGILSSGMRTEASLQGQMEDMHQHALEHHAEMVSREVTHKMLNGGEISGGNSVTLDSASQPRGTMMERVETAVGMGARGGFATPNEIRARFNMPRSDDEMADKLYQVTGAPGADGRVGDRASPGEGSGNDD